MLRHDVGFEKVMVMVSARTSQWLWTCVLTAVPMASALAQSPSAGVVRVSDRGAKPMHASYNLPGQYHAPPAAAYGYGAGYGYGNGHDASCQCPDCMGGKKAWKYGKSCEHYCTHSPDHGWSIPGKWPINRRGVQYDSYFPTAGLGPNGVVLGADVVYPMVYQPTDTTQLGFYYQHVPFWMPQPNPLPPRPIPAYWHMYAPVAYASTFENGYGGWAGGDVIIDGTTVSPTPVETNVQPNAKPAELPPAPVKESAVPQPIERIGY